MIYLQILSGLEDIEKSNLSKVSLRTTKKCLVEKPSREKIFLPDFILFMLSHEIMILGSLTSHEIPLILCERA